MYINTPTRAILPKAKRLENLMPNLLVKKPVKLQAKRYPRELRAKSKPICISLNEKSACILGIAGPFIFSEKPNTKKPPKTIIKSR